MSFGANTVRWDNAHRWSHTVVHRVHVPRLVQRFGPLSRPFSGLGVLFIQYRSWTGQLTIYCVRVFLQMVCSQICNAWITCQDLRKAHWIDTEAVWVVLTTDRDCTELRICRQVWRTSVFGGYHKLEKFKCSNSFRWPAGIWKLKTWMFFKNKLIKQWDNM